MFGKEVSCIMEGDTAGPSRLFQQTRDVTIYAAYVYPNTEVA